MHVRREARATVLRAALVALCALSLAFCQAIAAPQPAGQVVVNGVRLAAPFYREGRHLYYPVLAIARALGANMTWDTGQKRLLRAGRPVVGRVELIDAAPCVTWTTLQRLFPEMRYGVSGSTAKFETRESRAMPADTASSSGSTATSGAGMTSRELAVIAELNLARTQPGQYAGFITATLESYHDNVRVAENGMQIRTKEGARAAQEAIAFLEKQRAVGPLDPCHGLYLAARDHMLDQSVTGATGHSGSDGSSPFDRIHRYGQARRMGENIAYGPESARDIVMQLIIDDGVADRGHRTNIYRAEYDAVGVAIGPHKNLRVICVMDFGLGFVETLR
ncbi:MAG: CAP domain-containing protein [Proteobacteria bacterium]|nr:CAP domain-containing protein [Pseudomonadota bacterium]